MKDRHVPNAEYLENITFVTPQAIDGKLRRMTPEEIEALQGEKAQPLAQDVIRLILQGVTLLRRWGCDIGVGVEPNIIPPEELERENYER